MLMETSIKIVRESRDGSTKRYANKGRTGDPYFFEGHWTKNVFVLVPLFVVTAIPTSLNTL